jgi:hypothetical protein
MSEKGRLLDLAGKLQQDPSLPGLRLQRVDRAPDPNVWSVRVSQELRAILWRDGSRNLLPPPVRADAGAARTAQRCLGRQGILALPVAPASRQRHGNGGTR